MPHIDVGLMIHSVIIGTLLMISSRCNSIGPAPFLYMNLSCSLKIMNFRPVLVKNSAARANYFENIMVQQCVVVGKLRRHPEALGMLPYILDLILRLI